MAKQTPPSERGGGEATVYLQHGFKPTPFVPVLSSLYCRCSLQISPILVGNLARIISPMNPLCTKWRARGQVVCLLLIKPFDQSPFSSAHVVLWAPPVCSVRQRTLLVQKCSQWDALPHMCSEIECVHPHLSTAFFPSHTVFVIKVEGKVIYNKEK